MMDKKIVAEMDQKVIDQQNTLEAAGVAGFFITTNPQVSPPSSCLNLKPLEICLILNPYEIGLIGS